MLVCVYCRGCRLLEGFVVVKSPVLGEGCLEELVYSRKRLLVRKDYLFQESKKVGKLVK